MVWRWRLKVEVLQASGRVSLAKEYLSNSQVPCNAPGTRVRNEVVM